MTDAERLRKRWQMRFPSIPEVGEELIARYGDGARVYHDLGHLADVLSAIDLLHDEVEDGDAVELAAWFHDAVYDVAAADNEQASARFAETLLGGRLPAGQLREVARLVMLTRDHAVQPPDANGSVLSDADLSVLVRDPAGYADYARRVRQEYAAVPDAAFRAGRAAVLRRLLARPALFHTRHGKREWEELAKTNLRGELARLEHGRPDSTPT
jgi:predicted metal-dependent HD superfamily phosphohydrolase